MEPTVIVCGYGRVGRHVTEFLHQAGVPLVVIDTKIEPHEPLPPGVRFVSGDCRKEATLREAGATTARGFIIVTSEDLINVSAAMLVRRINPDCRIVVRMFNRNLLKGLGSAVTNTTALSVSALTAPLLALSALTADCLAAFSWNGEPRQIAEIRLDDPTFLGRRIVEFEESTNLKVVGRVSGNQFSAWDEPNQAEPIGKGEGLIIYGVPSDLQPFLLDGDGVRGGVHWAGRLRRGLRSLRRLVNQVDLPVKLGASALVLTLILGTVVLNLVFGLNLADAFYQTTSITATGAGLNGENRSGTEKVFLSMLKLVGAAIVAGFTALLTQYLVRMKLAGALEVGRIPDRGHVVVCGLGNVGFRVVEELHRMKEPIVAVEQENDSPFAATVRRMGIPVILGDATVPAVLRQARCDTADAVIATSESELVNLEIALLVREMNDKQRVVVRMNETQFAETLRDSANIKRALALPSLAAPAFAAALWGDSIPTLATIHKRTYAIVELNLRRDDPISASTIDASAMRYGFLTLGIEPMRITVLIETAKLQALLNRGQATV